MQCRLLPKIPAALQPSTVSDLYPCSQFKRDRIPGVYWHFVKFSASSCLHQHMTHSRPSAELNFELNELLVFADTLADDIPVQRLTVDTHSRTMQPFTVADAEQSATRLKARAMERREKEREQQRRKYHRKKDRVKNMRQQALKLEKELEILKQREAEAKENTTIPNIGHGVEVPETREDMERMLETLLRTKSKLLKDNTQLRKQFREASMGMTVITELLYAEHKLYRAHDSHFRLLKPMSLQSCYDLHEEAAEAVNRFQRTTMNKPVVVSGWNEMRVVDRHLFKISLEKPHQRTTAKFACSQVWSLMMDPWRYRRIYSDVLDVGTRLVQKIDDNNFVFLEEMRSMDPNDNQLVKSAMLISRFQSNKGFRIYMRALDRKYIDFEDRITGESVVLPHEVWRSSEQLTWMEFDDTRNDMHTVRIRGILPTIGANVYYWMTEVVMMCLRCEKAVHGPRFSVEPT